MKNNADRFIRDFLSKVGRKGGKARAARYDRATLSKWGRKGGRPKKKEGKTK